MTCHPIARAIHNLSNRRERTLVKLNCAAIPTGLLESELFGHEKGAFAGAIAQRVGRFELANKGSSGGIVIGNPAAKAAPRRSSAPGLDPAQPHEEARTKMSRGFTRNDADKKESA